MPKYRKKPVVVEAVQITAADFNPALPAAEAFDGAPFSDFPNWVGQAIEEGSLSIDRAASREYDYAIWQVVTLEGIMKAGAGEWIIRGVNGEIYPCKPDIFEKTYELVEEPATAAA